MPSHALHIEYCKLAGIKSLVIIKGVNDMIDFPRSCRKYKEFREKKGQLLYSSNDVRCVN